MNLLIPFMTETPEAKSPDQEAAEANSVKELVVHVSKPEGAYTVLYAPYDRALNPAWLPSELDGVVVETGDANYVTNGKATFEMVHGLPQFKDLFLTLEEKRTPVYLLDVALPDLVHTIERTGFIAETAAGGMLLGELLQDAARNTLSRRQFLKLTGGALGTWLMMPWVTQAGKTFAPEEYWSGSGRDLERVTRRLHPEAYALSLKLRDLIVVHKEAMLMESMGTQPHFVTVVGMPHTDMEDLIQSSTEDRQRLLEAAQPLLAKLSLDETFYSAKRFDFDGSSWYSESVIEFPPLETLIDDEPPPSFPPPQNIQA